MASIVVSGDTSGAITISAPATAGTNTLSLPANTGTAILDYSTPAYRNRIINGAMVIDQRNAGASVTGNDGTFSVDRWVNIVTQTAKFTVQQNAGAVTPPAGFTNYLGVTSSSAYAVTATDYFNIRQRIEGFNVADLGWGAASAQAVTVSFWVRSSLTGAFGGNIANSAGNRSYPFSFTINSANTWEYKTVTIPGDTTGTWLTNNSTGLMVSFNLGAGSTYSGTVNTWAGTFYSAPTGATSVVGTNGATFYITGVQLEKGSTATSFDYRPYGTELQLCQRYYTRFTSSGNVYGYFIAGFADGTTNFNVAMSLPVTMRASPSLSYSTLRIYGPSIGTITALSTNRSSPSFLSTEITCTGLTTNSSGLLQANNSTSAYLDASAEL